ncbi:MAG: chromosome segregation protein [Methanocella sp. PtaU1.Bin125]|nr:MAG: chromosome segregation protein [Methanocella sp. PtaU1.Bin125]
MLRPAYKIKMGSKTFESESGNDVLSISTDTDLRVPLDTFRVLLRPGNGAAGIKKGDETTIELGNEGALTRVFTGLVDTVLPGISGVTVTGYTAAKLLMETRLHQIYEKQSSGAIIDDLAARAGLKARDPEDGIDFPMYVIDASKPVYEHMIEIASLNGFDLFIKPDGAVVFKKYGRSKPRPFKYGRDIIKSEVWELTPQYDCVKVVGESPASSKGTDKAHWISKGGTGVTSGSGTRVLVVRHPAVRDSDTADRVAAAKMEAILVELGGRLVVLGNPKVALGDTIAIKELPNEQNNGEFEVVSVSHEVSIANGFVTTIGWIKKVTVEPGESPAIETPAVPAPPKKPGMLEEMLAKAKEAEDAAREALIEAIEAAEEALEGVLQELQAAASGVDKKAAEMIDAAGEAKKKAEEAAREALSYVDELKKELKEAKKELDKVVDDAEKEYNEARAKVKEEIDKVKAEADKLKKEAEDYVRKAEGKVKEAKDKIAEELRPVQDEVDKARAEIAAWEEKAENLEQEAKDKVKEAKDKIAEELRPVQDEVDRIKGEIDEHKRKVHDLKNQIPPGGGATGANVQGMDKSADTSKIEKEIRDKIEEAEGKVKDLEKQVEDRLKQIEEKKKQIEDKEKEVEKEVEGKVKEAEDKVKALKEQVEDRLKQIEDKKKQIEDKAKEIEDEYKKKKEEALKKYDELIGEEEKIEKEAEEKLKELEGKVKEARQKLDEGVKEIQDRIDEAQKTANNILKDASKAYNEAVKKVEEGRREMARAMESMKSAYRASKEKVEEGRKAAGLD